MNLPSPLSRLPANRIDSDLSRARTIRRPTGRFWSMTSEDPPALKPCRVGRGRSTRRYLVSTILGFWLVDRLGRWIWFGCCLDRLICSFLIGCSGWFIRSMDTWWIWSDLSVFIGLFRLMDVGGAQWLDHRLLRFRPTARFFFSSSIDWPFRVGWLILDWWIWSGLFSVACFFFHCSCRLIHWFVYTRTESRSALLIGPDSWWDSFT